MSRATVITAIVVLFSMATAPVAMAGGPTCAGVDLGNGPLANHGEHVIEDYVTQGERGARGGPAHFDHPAEVGPGASFCLEQARAQSPSGPPGS